MNAIILAAGTSSRFVPLSSEFPKGLMEVHGEILIERQIRQLKEAGIEDITVVLGYKADQFDYLAKEFSVSLVYNEDYARYNNSSSIFRVLDRLRDTFICCSDHYYVNNVFLDRDDDSFYAVQYSDGPTDEWCVKIDDSDRILQVEVGGGHAWYLSGHAFFNQEYSNKFKDILLKEYSHEDVRRGYWEDVFVRHIDDLKMKAKRYSRDDFYEFDSLDELRLFDSSYLDNTRSPILQYIASRLGCRESQLHSFLRADIGRGDFYFDFEDEHYLYKGSTAEIFKRDFS